MSSMITATAWVPRGFAAPFPKKYEFNEREFERIAELANLQLEDAQEDLEEAQDEANKTGKKGEESKTITKNEPDLNDDDLKEYDLEHYDDDEDDLGNSAMAAAAAAGQPLSIFGNVKALTFYESNKQDPNITLTDADAEDEEDDRLDLQVTATDNLVLATKLEDELATLEVYMYQDADDNLYVHHDIMLPAIPLCVEWLDIRVGERDSGVAAGAAANFVAIGTMDPDIEIWDLDVIDCMYPNAILGQGGKEGTGSSSGGKKSKDKKKKKGKKSVRPNDAYHVDAVLALAANRRHRNLLASASADTTVKLWDLNTATCAKSSILHTNKVCALAWHLAESTVLLSGSYDRTVVASDMRAADGTQAPRWGVESDVESVRWDPHDPNFFFVATESGMVHYMDARKPPANPKDTQGVWTLQAHDEVVSALDINAVVPGFLATGSGDNTVKLWNLQASGPSMVVSRKLDVGKVFSANFAPDADVAFRLAVAGSKGKMTVWDTSTNTAVRRAFASKVPEQAAGAELADDRLVAIEDGGSVASSDEEDEEEADDDDEGAAESMDED